MGFSTEISKSNVEKHALVVFRPRARVTGWSDQGGNVWRASFNRGPVSRAWIKFDFTDGFEDAGVMPTSDQQFWYDEENEYLYIYLDSGNGPDDPTDIVYAGVYGPTVAGLTVEFELYVATSAFTGPSDPMDANSPVVDWLPVLKESPTASKGSADSLFGFNPLDETALVILNEDGWLLPHLYDCAFNLCSISSYVMADRDVERAAEKANVSEIFRGYGGAPSLGADGRVSIPCFDFLAFLQRPANPATRISKAEFPNVNPEAVKPGQEWWIRRVRGMVDDHVPVNIDYSATPSTSNNRDWLTHEEEGSPGAITLVIDHAAANTTTRTYFTTTPKVNPGDAIWFNHSSGGEKYQFVSAVNYASKYIDHGVIVRTITAGDTMLRYAVGWIKVRDSDGNWWNLFAKRNFLYMNNGTLGNNPDWGGFRLADNWEGDISFPETFDPSKHTILCRVYGDTAIDTYSDTTPVGAVVNQGGNAAQAVSILHYLLRQSGIPNDMIDPDTFSGVSTNHPLGIAWPRSAADFQVPTYKDLIGLVLQSMIWKLIYVDLNGAVGIGLIETGPFVSTADYEADDVDFSEFSFEHNYTDIYSEVALSYGNKESARSDDLEIFKAALALSIADGTMFVTAQNLLARDLHLVENVFQLEILQYIETNAQLIADRYAYALGDRRAFYKLTLGVAFLNKANLGASYQVKRKQLPGFALDVDVNQERQTMLIEATKSARNVTLTLEDQKGIQDNSGDWT